MTLQWLIPPWAVALIFIPLLVICVLCFMRNSSRSSKTRWARRTAMVLLLGIVAMRPAIPNTAYPTVHTNVDVFFVVDQTGSMVAEDYDGTKPRLDGVKQDMKDIVQGFPGARFSIIGWGSSASRQLPLTSDTTAFDSWIETMTQEITAYSDGSDAGRPRDLLERTLSAEQERNPGNVRVVYFLSDGEQTDSTDIPASYERCAQYVDGGEVLGYGTTAGGRMKAYDPKQGSSLSSTYITDPTQPGNPVAISKIDEGHLKGIADQLKIPYTHRTAPGNTADLIPTVDIKAAQTDGRSNSVSVYSDLYWIPAIVLFILLLWEAFDALRSVALPRRRSKKTGSQQSQFTLGSEVIQ